MIPPGRVCVHRAQAFLLTVGLTLAHGPVGLAQTPPASPANGAAQTSAPPSAPHPGGASQKPPASGAAKVTQFGNVSVSGYRRLTGTLSGESARFVGPRTTLATTDLTSKSQITLHADDIQARKAGRGADADLTGNVRYTLVQQTADRGTRTVEGTAGHAIYRSAARQIELSGGVRAQITDAARLTGPGTIQAERVVVDLTTSPYRYTLAGRPAANDLRFTPRPSAPVPQGKEQGSEKENPANPLGKPSAPDTQNADRAQGKPVPSSRRAITGEIHVRQYETGVFQIGQVARFSGPATTLEFADADARTNASLTAPVVEAFYADQGDRFERIMATGGVRYRVARAGSPDHPGPIVTGTGSRAEYNPTGGAVTISGGVDATLTAPDSLLAPATLTVGTLKVGLGDPQTIEMTGAPARTRLQFMPKLPSVAKPDASKPASVASSEAPRFAYGTVTISGFASATLTPGKTAAMIGDETVVETEDKAARTLTKLQASKVVATFAKETGLAKAEATGNVRFEVAQPTLSGKTMQTVRGTATRAELANTKEDRVISAVGPFRMVITDTEQLQKPGVIIGASGDTLRLNLAAKVYAYDIDSPRETATVEFTPRETVRPKAAPVPPAALRKPGTGKNGTGQTEAAKPMPVGNTTAGKP